MKSSGCQIPPGSGGHDEWGFRNKSVPESVDIVTLGDSHTYGNTAKMTESWPFVLGRQLGKSVYNLGLGGYGPNQYYYLLKNKALGLQPRVIICGFWMGDDFDNALKITYGLDYWKALRSPEFADRLAEWDIWEKPPLLSWHKKMRNWLSSKSMVYRLVVHGLMDGLRGRAQLRNSSRLNDPVPILRTKDKKIVEAFYKPSDILSGLDQKDRGVKEGMRLSFEMIREMNDICREKNITFIVAVIPTKELVFSDYLRQDKDIPLSGILNEIILNEHRARESFFVYLDDLNIKYIDVFPYLKKAAVSEKLYANGLDTHPNKNGYGIIAEAMVEPVEKDLISARQ